MNIVLTEIFENLHQFGFHKIYLIFMREHWKLLQSYSLTDSNLNVCLAGGENVKNVVPMGYAGNPAGYEKKLEAAKTIFQVLTDYCGQIIMDL